MDCQALLVLEGPVRGRGAFQQWMSWPLHCDLQNAAATAICSVVLVPTISTELKIRVNDGAGIRYVTRKT